MDAIDRWGAEHLLHMLLGLAVFLAAMALWDLVDRIRHLVRDRRWRRQEEKMRREFGKDDAPVTVPITKEEMENPKTLAELFREKFTSRSSWMATFDCRECGRTWQATITLGREDLALLSVAPIDERTMFRKCSEHTPEAIQRIYGDATVGFCSDVPAMHFYPDDDVDTDLACNEEGSSERT